MSSIIDAARALLARCDGAVKRDEQGYNGADAPFVRKLLSRERITKPQLLSLHSRLAKYRAQLAAIGIDYDTIEVPDEICLDEAGGSDENSANPPLSPRAPEAAPTKAKSVPPWLIGAKPWPGNSIAFFKKGWTARPQQIDAIRQIDEAFLNGKRAVVLEAAVGCGKSLIQGAAVNALRAAGGETHWICPQKTLQDQLERDFPEPEIQLVKGRNNFWCAKDIERKCDDAPCTDRSKGILKECVKLPPRPISNEPYTLMDAMSGALPPEVHLCPYWQQLVKGIQNDVTLFNFASFFSQTAVGRFGPRDLLVIDEAHGIPQAVTNHVALELTEWALRLIDVTINSEISSKEELLRWLEDRRVLELIQSRLEDIDEDGADDSDDPFGGFDEALNKKELDALRDLERRILNFVAWLERTEWIVETVTYEARDEIRKKITARPLYAHPFTKELLWNYGKRILCVSATVLDVGLWAKEVGLDPADIAHVYIGSDFPVENRPVHMEYAGNFSFKYFEPAQNPKDPTRPKYVSKVKQILARHVGQRGIIHTHSFKLAKVLLEEIRSPRFLFQEDFGNDKSAMLAEHAGRPGSVLVAPALHEGVDLKGDLARFSVICKVPWPDLNDKVIKERIARDERYYAYLTALKLAQTYGRAIRSKEDWAYTYILDSGFDFFRSKYANLLPKWFMEALKKYGPNPETMRKE